LSENLIIENKIVGVRFEGQLFEKRSRISPIPGVVFREFRAKKNIFDQREKAVRDVFPPRHSSAQRAASKKRGSA
jgi:hypothetical protein